MRGNCDTLMARLFSLQHDVATFLVNGPIESVGKLAALVVQASCLLLTA